MELVVTEEILTFNVCTSLFTLSFSLLRFSFSLLMLSLSLLRFSFSLKMEASFSLSLYISDLWMTSYDESCVIFASYLSNFKSCP